MTDDELLAAFEAGTVSRERWDHRAHLRAAFAVLRRDGLDGSRGAMREGLQGLLTRFGVEDGPTRGYHETITVAWLRLVDAADRGHGPLESSDALLEACSYLLDKRLLRLFYGKERLTSPEAKRAFVDGDLCALP